MSELSVALGHSARIVGRLRFEVDGNRQYSMFEYTDEWFSSGGRFALSPDLPLNAGGHYSSGRDDTRNALPGCLSDAAPDSWGRGLMTRAFGGGLSECDFLTLSDDRTRQGALRLLDERMNPLSEFSPSVPRLLDLAAMRDLALGYEGNQDVAEEEVRHLAGISGSLGGD